MPISQGSANLVVLKTFSGLLSYNYTANAIIFTVGMN